MGEVVTTNKTLPAYHSTVSLCETYLFPDLRTPSLLHSLIQQGKLTLAVEPFLPGISIEDYVSNDAPSPLRTEFCSAGGVP